MKTAKQMFGAAARDVAAMERDQAEADARLDAPLTRREVLEAIESVRLSWSSTNQESRTRELLDRLMEALK